MVFTNKFSTILIVHFHCLNKEKWEHNAARLCQQDNPNPVLSVDHLLTEYHPVTICSCGLKSAVFLPIPFFNFFNYLCGVLLWILNELKCPRKCWALSLQCQNPCLRFMCLGWSKSLCKLSEKIWATSQDISNWDSKIPRQLLLFCMFATSLLQDVTGCDECCAEQLIQSLVGDWILHA